MHVADAAMWPEAVNQRASCCGVRFNLATSAHAKLPTEKEEEEEEAAADQGAGARAAEGDGDEVGKAAAERGSSSRSRSPSPSSRGLAEPRPHLVFAERRPHLVFAERRPPSLPPEEVGLLGAGMGGHKEGGWEAVAGPGASALG